MKHIVCQLNFTYLLILAPRRTLKDAIHDFTILIQKIALGAKEIKIESRHLRLIVGPVVHPLISSPSAVFQLLLFHIRHPTALLWFCSFEQRAQSQAYYQKKVKSPTLRIDRDILSSPICTSSTRSSVAKFVPTITLEVESFEARADFIGHRTGTSANRLVVECNSKGFPRVVRLLF